MPSKEFNDVVALIRSTAADQTVVPTWKQARARLDELGALFPVPDGVGVVSVDIAGVPCERFEVPGSPSESVLMYLHGGAYTAGSLDSHRSLAARLAVASGADVVAVGYRLAPEHPHPAGLDDAAAVYRALLEQGTAARRVCLAGDSAGGGLAAALLVRLRDEGTPLPAGAVLLSPWLDLTLTSDAITTVAARDPMLTAASLARSAVAYAKENLRDPFVSPVYAELTGLPPILILVGTAEILIDDSRRFAANAVAADVTVELDVKEDLIHVWPFIDGIPESDEALDRIGRWMRRHTA